MTQHERAQAFLDMIESTRETRTRKIMSDAAKEAGEIVRGARAEARVRVHRVVLDNRERAESALGAARAEAATLFRKSSQDADRAALSDGTQKLTRLLLARWQRPLERRAWIDNLVADALAVLPRASWRIEHPADLSPAELAEARAEIEKYCGVLPELRIESSIVAGLRIFASAAVLDGTLDGVLVRRAEVEGQLLGEIYELMRGRDER